jgi:outer membrane biosynthesis protein TonB
VDHTIDTGGWITDISTVMRGNSTAIGSTGFPQPAPSEAEATGEVRQAPIPPTPPPPPEEQPIDEEDPEEEPPVADPEPDEEPVDERHIDAEENRGTPGMIVYNGKFVFGEMGGGLFAYQEKYTREERTFAFRLIQKARPNTYKVEIDKNLLVKDGRKYSIGGIQTSTILSVQGGVRSNEPIATNEPHNEAALQDLINSCLNLDYKTLDYHRNAGNVARRIYSALNDDFKKLEFGS